MSIWHTIRMLFFESFICASTHFVIKPIKFFF